MFKIRLILIFSTVLFSQAVFSWGGSSSSITAAYSACASQLASFANDQYWGTAQGTICKNYPGGSNSGLIGFYNAAQGGPAFGFDYPAGTGCQSPATWSDTNHVCVSPVVCTVGQTKTLLILVGTYPSAGSPPTIQLNQDRTNAGIAPVTVSQGGCGYDLPLNPNQNTGCFSSSSGLMYCRVQATNNGRNISGADTALDGALTADKTPVPSAKQGCILTQSGEEICASKPSKNCGTFNGIDLCVKDQTMTSGGMPASIVNGTVSIGDTTNVNGQINRCYPTASGVPLCINPFQASACGPGTFFTCVNPEPTTNAPSPPYFQLSHDPVTLTKQTNVTNADSTRTVTTTTTQDVVNSVPTVTTEIYNTSNQLTQRTSTGPGSTTGAGSGTGIGSAAGANAASGDNVDTGAPGTAKVAGDTSGLDGIFTSATSALTSSIDASKFLTTPVTAPAATTCQTVPMNYKRLNYTFDPCAKLATFREMFGYLLYVMTAFAIYEIAARKPA